jgi:peptide deformylase
MILPIYTYGHPILKKVAQPIDSSYSELSALIQNMWETMYQAKGVGLAAPQIGLSIRLFLVDTVQAMEEEDSERGIKKVFINPTVLSESGDFWDYEEGCLSIPDIRGDVTRQETVKISYQDENFNEFEETFSDVDARVIQHEYDHLEGKLFTEKLKPIRKMRISKKLENIKKGQVSCDYRIKPWKK